MANTIESINARHDTSELHASEALRTYYIIFAWLMGLLIVTVIAAQVDLDRLFPGLNLIVAMIIATVKGSLVVLYFMHVKHSSKLTWIFATAAFLWLGILLFMTYNDYLTRGAFQPLSTNKELRKEAVEHTKTEAKSGVSHEAH